MTRIGTAIPAAAALAAAAVLIAPAMTVAQQQPVTIGVSLSFTGPDPVGATEFNSAVAAWQKEHGTVAGGRQIKLVRLDDTGPKPDVATRNAQQLIVQDHAQILVGGNYTPTSIAMAKVSTAGKVAYFDVNAATSNILKDEPYSSRFGFTTAQVCPPLARWALKNGIKTAFTLVADYGPGLDAAKSFDGTFEGGGGKIIGSGTVPLTNTDFSAYVQRLKDLRPDALFVFLPAGPGSAALLKSFDDAGLQGKVKIIATGDVTLEDQLPQEGDAALGIVTTYDYSMDHPSALNREFVKDFLATSGGVPPNFTAVATYDIMHAIYAALDATHGDTDATKIIAAVKGMKFESPRGPIMIDPSTRDIVQNVYLRRVEKKDGRLVNVEFETVPMVKDPTETY